MIFEDCSEEFYTLEYSQALKDPLLKDFVITTNDIKNLDNDRPLGLSGHMRVKNEALSIRASVESCIECLDELILVVQESIDKTEEIANELALKYKDKIRLYKYLPEVIPPASSAFVKKDDVISNTPSSSIHNFAHYYNFGLIKIRYKYYIKIDADQIYIASYLQRVKNAILKADKFTKANRGVLNKILGRAFYRFHHVLFNLLGMESFIKFISLIEGRCAFSLCGINIHLKEYETRDFEEEFIKVFGYDSIKAKAFQDSKNFENALALANFKNLFVSNSHLNGYIFNGGELPIFAPNSKSICYWLEKSKDEYQPPHAKYIHVLGIAWFHLGPIKRHIFAKQDFISLQDFLKLDKKDLLKAHYKDPYFNKHFLCNIKTSFKENVLNIKKAIFSKK